LRTIVIYPSEAAENNKVRDRLQAGHVKFSVLLPTSVIDTYQDILQNQNHISRWVALVSRDVAKICSLISCFERPSLLGPREGAIGLKHKPHARSETIEIQGFQVPTAAIDCMLAAEKFWIINRGLCQAKIFQLRE